MASASQALEAILASAALQVSGRVASQAAQAAAARLGKGKAALALELVGFDAGLGAAMQYAFGNAFVCKARLCMCPAPTATRSGACSVACNDHYLPLPRAQGWGVLQGAVRLMERDG